MKNSKRPNMTERQLWRDMQKRNRNEIYTSPTITFNQFNAVIDGLLLHGIISPDEHTRLKIEGSIIVN